eukprot:gene37385-44842_t
MTNSHQAGTFASPAGAPPTLAEATRVWARIGFLSFGGPAGQIALMHRELVETRRWIPESRFLHALNYCMLLPGPEAQQLATYIGWLLHGTRGGIIAGTLFVLPGYCVIMALSTLYALFHETHWLGSLFYGLKAAVLAVVFEALVRVGRRALKSRSAIWIAAASFIAIFALAVPFPLIIIAAAAIGTLGAHTLTTGALTRYNYAPTNYFQRPDQRVTAGAFLNYDASPAFQPYLEFMFMSDHSEAQIAPSGDF